MHAVASQVGLAVLALVCSWLIASFVRQSATRLRLVQIPNERSSHTVPTPSGGGISIAVVGTISGLWLASAQSLTYFYVAVGTSAVAATVGLLDDRFDLSSRLRLVLHCALVIVLLFTVGPLPAFGTPIGMMPTAVLYALVGFFGVWWINLFNFMDGIDGMAGSQAVFMAMGMLLIGLSFGQEIDPLEMPTWTLILSAAIVGFLLINWQPAKIFMGDVGSNYLAVWLLAIGMYMVQIGSLSYAASAILSAVFVADATVTIVRRALSGDPWHSAHRNHAYQKLARHWQSHSRVVLLYLCINVVWLYPLALLSQTVPSASWIVVLVAYLPVVGLCLFANAGKPELPAQGQRR